MKVKAAKEEAARLYETMRNAEARVKSLEINHVPAAPWLVALIT